MRIGVFTGNQPRHLALIEALASVADGVLAVQECGGSFPTGPDTAAPLRAYFAQVVAAEAAVFGDLRFSPMNVRALPIKAGTLNALPLDVLAPVLEADLVVVFGASYIKGALCDALVERGAINVHAGVSPQYRGAACNFWALHDGRPELVGCTIHRLARGLDSGPMLFHALPAAAPIDPYLLGMEAIRVAHVALADAIGAGMLRALAPVVQDRSKELRYSRAAEFTAEIAARYLADAPSADDIGRALAMRDPGAFVRPVIGEFSPAACAGSGSSAGGRRRGAPR